MRETLERLPNEESREEYKREAASLLQEAIDKEHFSLFAIDSFDPWMWRVSRSGPDHTLIVFRHKENH